MMRHTDRTVRGWLPLAMLAALLAVALPAAAQVSTGTIEVLTVDQQGLAMPGVTVQVRNTDTGADRVGVADEFGRAVFAALPPGPYAVSGNLEGFAPITDQEVVIRVGQTARVEFTMQVQVSETIVVTAEVPLVDVLKTDSSTNIVPEQIENLPVADRDFERLAFIAPGVQREVGSFRFIQNSPVVGAGGNASQTSIQVDGVDFTDQALGLSRARFSQDAIREFRVV
ncbi:MAG TPA: carboxypeptidase-like regulatory domain-containing protein, partial [Thermoanaerobaculales bacterium]|nr:carboxypeptidase-like regulatory domain-containing protein [Thermoanaerobaculales bacterium]